MLRSNQAELPFDGEDTDENVLAVINGKMNKQPQLHIGQIERSHRVGRKTTESQHDELGLNHGLGKYFSNETIKHWMKYPFSLNMDESTSTGNNKKVLATIVSYYNTELGVVVVEHLCSVELIKANTAAIFASLENTFTINNIPWTNLVSEHMDSCNVMRGTTNGLEVKLRREKAPHLLNKDGDSCHHIPYCAKKFCQPFSKCVEKLFTDIFHDHEWSSDLISG